jgi:hypothetical protein
MSFEECALWTQELVDAVNVKRMELVADVSDDEGSCGVDATLDFARRGGEQVLVESCEWDVVEDASHVLIRACAVRAVSCGAASIDLDVLDWRAFDVELATTPRYLSPPQEGRVFWILRDTPTRISAAEQSEALQCQ